MKGIIDNRTKSALLVIDLRGSRRRNPMEVVMNCWEFKKCGREKGGAKAEELGVCPAWPDHGKNCAHVAGTLCGGRVQGAFATKLASCMQCEFYKSENYSKERPALTK
jgi:hypothetical protein